MSRSTSCVLRAISMVACVILSAVMAHAQYRASIQGAITDPQGAVVPGATVTLMDKETGRILQATSSDSGIYNFNALPPTLIRSLSRNLDSKRRFSTTST